MKRCVFRRANEFTGSPIFPLSHKSSIPKYPISKKPATTCNSSDVTSVHGRYQLPTIT